MEKVKKSPSIRFSLFLSVCLAIIAAQLLYMGALTLIDNALLNYMDPRPDAFVFKDGNLVSINYGPVPSGGVAITDSGSYDAIMALRSVCPILIYGGCLITATGLFYRVKLKKPFQALNTGIEKIAKQDLNFHIPSRSGDELGRLCTAFEDMRGALSSAFQTLWSTQENQRSMYRAFAHDLRTPLTVIKGNNEITQLVAVKNRDWEQAVEAAKSSDEAIARIERYADQVKELESIEDWTVTAAETELKAFTDAYRRQAELVAASAQKKVEVQCTGAATIRIDREMLLRVLDNLLCNGLEFAASAVRVTFSIKKQFLCVTVSDDGPGFTDETLKQAVQPFFTTNKPQGHMGIGLTIVQKLLDKMQGSLAIENGETGGCVKFSLPV